MPRFSVYSDPKKVSQFINRFFDAITLIEDRGEVVRFFKDLLTPTEVRMLSKRLQIADMLAKGYKYEAIRNYVRVTSQTISAVHNKLNFGEDGLTLILQKLEKIESKRQERVEGKRGLLSQPPGVERAVTGIVSREIGKIIRRKQKENSVKTRE